MLLDLCALGSCGQNDFEQIHKEVFSLLIKVSLETAFIYLFSFF